MPPRAGDSAFDLYGEVHLRGDRIPFELNRILRVAGRDIEQEGRDLGDSLGRGLAQGARERLDRDGGDGLIDNVLGDGRRRRRGGITRAITSPFRAVGNTIQRIFTGPVGRAITSLAQSASNSFFNMGARGAAAFALMIPILGMVISLIVVLIGALEALGALLLLLPATLAAVGLQVGILMIAFNGVGTAIAGAFQANNATELNNAIKDLTPSAQAFVRAMLPIKDVWQSIKDTAQEGFFSQAVGGMEQFTAMVTSPQLLEAIRLISIGLGRVADAVLRGLSSESFLKFLEVLGPATLEWLTGFARAVSAVAEGFNKISTAMMPFFSQVGAGLNNALERFGNWLSDLASDPAFQEWLQQIWEIMLAIGHFLGGLISWIFATVEALNKAGLAEFITIMGDIFYLWAAFMSTPLGTAAMRGFLQVLIALAVVLTAILTIIGLILGAFSAIVDAASFLIVVVGGLFVAIGSGIAAAVKKFLEWIDKLWVRLKAIPAAFKTSLWEGIKAVANFGIDLAKALWDSLKAGFNAFIEMGKRIWSWIWSGIKGGLHSVGQDIAHIITFGYMPSSSEQAKMNQEFISKVGGALNSANPQQQATINKYVEQLPGWAQNLVQTVKTQQKAQSTTNVTVQAGAIVTNVQTQATPEAGARLANAQSTQLASAISSGQDVRNMKSPGIF